MSDFAISGANADSLSLSLERGVQGRFEGNRLKGFHLAHLNMHRYHHALIKVYVKARRERETVQHIFESKQAFPSAWRRMSVSSAYCNIGLGRSLSLFPPPYCHYAR
jgi:hypothetical protein